MNSNRQSRRDSPSWIWIPLIFLAGVGSVFAIAYFSGALHAGGYLPYYFPFWIIFPLFFIGVFFFAFRWSGCRGWWSMRGYYNVDSALEVLRERFAHGDLTKDQYVQMRKDLEV